MQFICNFIKICKNTEKKELTLYITKKPTFVIKIIIGEL